ncbi:MAG: rRNA pseudouridine synthase [Proteobacteria bacterium]|nr:rRNA pseudouridine synthase [Pseudomonadota bacterium]MBU1708588.1 rRNA pseudouridine synthase [Pseudomonadota bacterium]
MKERLQKILANAGIASRRKAEELILSGKVSVDGKVITELGFKADPQKQRIEFEGSPLVDEQEKIYILLNKPRGYLTTLHDPQNRPIITSLLADISTRVYPVGRLDLDTEGALILTNDGDFSNQILHPSKKIKKTYIATVFGHPARQKLDQLVSGIEIEGKKTAPAKITKIKSRKLSTSFEICIHEGRKRQIRMMFEAVGHKVIDLKRIAYGKLKLGKLPSGKYRFLEKKDLEKIFS